MTKVKWDVSASDPDEEIKGGGSFESPAPGRYAAKINSVTEKGSGGDPDKPMLEIVFEMIKDDKGDLRYAGSRVWYYVLLPGHPSYEGFVVQKTAQFLRANGMATARKRKGVLDTDDLVDEINVVQIKAGKNLDGDYRGEVSNVFEYDEEDFGANSEDDEDDDLTPEEPDAIEDDEDEPEEDASDDEEEVPPYDEWSLTELREELDGRGLETTGRKAALVERLEEDDETEEEEQEETKRKSKKGDDDFPFDK